MEGAKLGNAKKTEPVNTKLCTSATEEGRA